MSHSCTFFPNYVKKTTVTSKSVNFESTQCDENLANDVKKSQGTRWSKKPITDAGENLAPRNRQKTGAASRGNHFSRIERRRR